MSLWILCPVRIDADLGCCSVLLCRVSYFPWLCWAEHSELANTCWHENSTMSHCSLSCSLLCTCAAIVQPGHKSTIAASRGCPSGGVLVACMLNASCPAPCRPACAWWRSARRATGCSGTTASSKRRCGASRGRPPRRLSTAPSWRWGSCCSTQVGAQCGGSSRTRGAQCDGTSSTQVGA